jgi:hypothetical protein
MARAKVSHSWNFGLFGAVERGQDQEYEGPPVRWPLFVFGRG